MRNIFTLFLLLFFMPAFAQGPVLQPSIGLNSPPSASDTVCPIPVYTGSYYTSGYSQGDTIPDFTLYKRNGDSLNIRTELQSGLPVLLVAGSYTCPVFRDKVASLNNMASIYNGQLKVYVVYTVEAHPVVDPSPYSGNLWVTTQNQNEGVLYRQPVTYGQRQAMVDTMLMNMTITPEILIDGPCNNWWSNFGPAPNNAYLIDTNGVIYRKHGWFHKLPDNMYCAIDSLLNTSSGNCVAVANNGTFSFSLDADSTITGYPTDILSVYCTLTNNSSTASVTIDIVRMQENVPAGWASALCTDICLSPYTDTTQVILPPSGTESFIMHFYTDTTESTGSTLVGFRNANNTNNRYKQGFYATTVWDLGLNNQVSAEGIGVYPNPSPGEVRVITQKAFRGEVIVTDISGRIVRIFPSQEWSGGSVLSLSELEQGMYFLNFYSRKGVTVRRLILAR